MKQSAIPGIDPLAAIRERAIALAANPARPKVAAVISILKSEITGLDGLPPHLRALADHGIVRVAGDAIRSQREPSGMRLTSYVPSEGGDFLVAFMQMTLPDLQADVDRRSSVIDGLETELRVRRAVLKRLKDMPAGTAVADVIDDEALSLLRKARAA